jgi:hypothetical protein
MKWSDVFKTVGKIAEQEAPAIITAINPIAGAIAQAVSTAVISAQAKHGVGNGDAKKQTAMQSLSVAAPLAMLLLEAAGKKVDEQRFAEGVSKFMDGLVEILSAADILPSKP